MWSPSGRAGALYTAAFTLLGVVALLLFHCQPLVFQKSPDLALNRLRQNRDDLDASGFPLANVSRLLPRDDYTCGPGKPCSNGACCSANGHCGYCEAYCGTGCISNCDAVSECGECASPAGRLCPLNTCCSAYGYCGTSEAHCGDKCQSNCIMNLKPSGSTGQVRDRVIGYYSSWSKQSACHQVDLSDLPVRSLTHLNFAFAYIDPQSFELIPMSQETPTDFFQSASDVKRYNRALKVFISVGGWAFSDNGTVTQPVFGNIASSSQHRQKFAQNVARFLDHYGFDGIDIDWEFPGAPDRGGRPVDTANYVLLLQDLRSTLDKSIRSLGITFTAPSSYGYLKWYDLPNMLRYSDWVNAMTYDFHGVWDSKNGVGSIIQGHTNLTDINRTLELFWRVNIPPSKISIGFGLYGRSFQLSDPNCTSPGCSFSGGADPGPCSATSGVLMFYEIQALLNQHPELQPVHDKSAAVKYVVYNGNQWVSYDDADTFQQKVQWANDIGIGGSMIWASDADDDKYLGHSALTGDSIGHVVVHQEAFAQDQINIAENMIGENGQYCKQVDFCVPVTDTSRYKCGKDRLFLGWGHSDCKKGEGKIYCCPGDGAPNNCLWRGGTKGAVICNGQCHVGEAYLWAGSTGGWPREDDTDLKKCGSGHKVFCCEAGGWNDLIEGCYWTSCGGSCKDNEDAVSDLYDSSKCTIFSPHYKYCCPKPSPLYDCHWSACTNPECNPGEVTIATNNQGSGYSGCAGSHKRSNCCKVKSPPKEATTCRINICDLDPAFCPSEYEEDDDDDECDNPADDESIRLAKRMAKRPYKFWLVDVPGPITDYAFDYAGRGAAFLGIRYFLTMHRWLSPTSNECMDCEVTNTELDMTNLPYNLPRNMQIDHPIDLQVMPHFVRSANTGILRSGAHTVTPIIPSNLWKVIFFNSTGLRAPLTPSLVFGGSKTTQPSTAMWEALGSRKNAGNFVPAAAGINRMKGTLFKGNDPMDTRCLRRYTRQAIAGNRTAHELLLQGLRGTIHVFNYLNDPMVEERFLNVVRDVATVLERIEAARPEMKGLLAHWKEWVPDYMMTIENHAQAWLQKAITHVRTEYQAAIDAIGPFPAFATQTFQDLNVIEGKIDRCYMKAMRKRDIFAPSNELQSSLYAQIGVVEIHNLFEMLH